MDRIEMRYLFLNFAGRIPRQPFWIGIIMLFGAQLLAGYLFAGAPPVHGALAVLLVYPLVAVAVKRCHDRGKSGWWVPLALVPVIGLFWWVIDLGILKGTEGGNQFGPDPLAQA
jgi:uncharacterized membrane protein YhaH (DUF805 family)